MQEHAALVYDYRWVFAFTETLSILASPVTKPKPPSATSIPAILKSLQDEWVWAINMNCYMKNIEKISLVLTYHTCSIFKESKLTAA